MNRARLRIASVAIGMGLIVLSWWACSSNEERAHPSDAATDSGGLGASGGVSWTGGGGASATGGSGGTTPDGSIDWGADPKWEPIPGTAVGCTFERLANASEVKAFSWKPCSWTADCEELTLSPKLFGIDNYFFPNSTVNDDGTTVRVGIVTAFGNNLVVVAREDGLTIDGFHAAAPSDKCRLWTASLWSARVGIEVAPLGVDQLGGILAEAGSAETPATFTLSNSEPGVPGSYPIGTSRWVWDWALPSRLTSVSVGDGGGFVEFAAASDAGPVLDYDWPVSTGPTFLFNSYELLDGGQVQSRIGWSDGITPPQPFLVPANAADGYGAIAYAHSHVGFIKGISNKSVNLYDSVELWYASYSEPPKAQGLTLLTKLPYNSIGGLIGAWGRLAMPMPAGDEGGTATAFQVWSIEKQTTRVHPPLPKEYQFRPPLLGLTRTHVYVGASKPSIGALSYLFRFKVE